MNPPPPPPQPKGERDTTHSPAGEGVGESQFGRLENKPSTLSTVLCGLEVRGKLPSMLTTVCWWVSINPLLKWKEKYAMFCMYYITYKGWLYYSSIFFNFASFLPLECGAWCCWQSWCCWRELTLYHSWRQWKQPWSETGRIRFSSVLCPPI